MPQQSQSWPGSDRQQTLTIKGINAEIADNADNQKNSATHIKSPQPIVDKGYENMLFLKAQANLMYL